MAIALVETVNAVSSTTPITLTSWTPGANDLLLLGVAQRDESRAISVSGNGLTWVEIANVDGNQGQNGVSLWRAMGAAPSSGSITVTITGNTLPVVCIAARFSGADTSGTNGSGAIEASATTAGPAVDDGDMLLAVVTVTADAWALAFGTSRSSSITLPGDETPIDINRLQGAGGDATRASMWYEGPVATPASTQLGGTNDLSAANDWCMIAVSIKPAAAAETAVPNALMMMGAGT